MLHLQGGRLLFRGGHGLLVGIQIEDFHIGLGQHPVGGHGILFLLVSRHIEFLVIHCQVLGLVHHRERIGCEGVEVLPVEGHAGRRFVLMDDIFHHGVGVGGADIFGADHIDDSGMVIAGNVDNQQGNQRAKEQSYEDGYEEPRAFGGRFRGFFAVILCFHFSTKRECKNTNFFFVFLRP